MNNSILNYYSSLGTKFKITPLNRFTKSIHLSERIVVWKICTVNAWVKELMTNDSNKQQYE